MSLVVGKCGNWCSVCPWGYRIRTNKNQAQWDFYVEDAKKYLGFTPTKNPCQGCQTPNGKLAKDVGVHNFVRGCSARKCAFHNGFENCAFCSRYPCDKIKEMNRSNRLDESEKRLGEHIPSAMYQAYIRPFEGMKTLNQVRTSLLPAQINEARTVEPKTSTVTAFPKVKKNKKNILYLKLHNALSKLITSSLGLSNIDTIAGQEMLLAHREVLLRLLWIIARNGKMKDAKILVDSITINANRAGTSRFPTTEAAWLRWLDMVSGTGFIAEMEFFTRETNKIMTPTGWLRERIPDTGEAVWSLKVSFEDTLGGIDSLKALQSYAKILDKKRGKTAFAAFKKAEMHFLKDT